MPRGMEPEEVDFDVVIPEEIMPPSAISTEEIIPSMALVSEEVKPKLPEKKEMPKPEEAKPEEEEEKPEEVPIKKAPTEEAPTEEAPLQAPAEIVEAPNFVEDMVDMEVVKGHPARFDVQVSGTPLPTLTWFRDGVEIKPDDHFTMEFTEDEGVGSLIIFETNPEDDAEYTCQATNIAGEAVSRADIFLQPKPRKLGEVGEAPRFTEDLVPLSVTEGDSVNLTCRVTGEPQPRVTWFRNDRPVDSGEKVSIDFDDGVCTLLIREVTVIDTAMYTCRASNPSGQATTMAELNIEGKSLFWNFLMLLHALLVLIRE